MRRTVKVSFKPRPLRPITMPVKIWTRSLSPSTTRVCTRTLSPTLKLLASLFSCSFSIASMMRFINSAGGLLSPKLAWQGGHIQSEAAKLQMERLSLKRPVSEAGTEVIGLDDDGIQLIGERPVK